MLHSLGVESPPPSGPPTIGHRQNKNRDTILPFGPITNWMHLVRARAMLPADAYRIAVGLAEKTPPIASVGYRLFWMRADGAMGCVEAPAERGKHLVVGRHDHCDLVLDDEQSVSLRHLLVRVSSLDDGFPVLNVLDLETKSGFELSDASKQRCVVATGPLVFRVGVHSLVALPNGVKVDPELPSPIVDRADSDPYVVRAERVDLAPRPPARVTRVTLIPSSIQLGQPTRAQAAIGDAQASSADRYEVLLECGAKRAAVRLSARDVEHGVLIGRNEKCIDAGLREILTESCSRVHALIIREKEGVFLYDTGSTCGTVCGGARVRCVAMSDEGTEVHLAGRHGAVMRWRSLS